MTGTPSAQRTPHTMNAEKVRELDRPAIVRGRADEPPLAVLVPYEQYLAWQEQIERFSR